MTGEDETVILESIVRTNVSAILFIGDVYSILREHFNNEILDAWVAQNTSKAFPCKCTACGEHVGSIIGCPNGAEVCQDCFDAGAENFSASS